MTTPTRHVLSTDGVSLAVYETGDPERPTVVAVHGYPDVPPYPASHGCARIPMWIAQTVYAQIAYGSTVYVYA